MHATGFYTCGPVSHRGNFTTVSLLDLQLTHGIPRDGPSCNSLTDNRLRIISKSLMIVSASVPRVYDLCPIFAWGSRQVPEYQRLTTGQRWLAPVVD